MKVAIQLFGGLREMLPQGSDFNRGEVELPEGASIEYLLQRVALPEHEDCLIIIDDARIHPQDYPDRKLKDGEEVVFLPPIKGG